MTPALRRECLRPGGLGILQYSLAMVIVLAALLDTLWWVPSYGHAPRHTVPAQISRCR